MHKGEAVNTTTIKVDQDVAVKDSSPAVIAYRVGQLETAQAKGFESIGDKIDNFISSFVTTKTFDDFLIDDGKEKTALSERLKKLEDFKDKIISRIALIAVSMFVVMGLAVYGLDKFLP